MHCCIVQIETLSVRKVHEAASIQALEWFNVKVATHVVVQLDCAAKSLVAILVGTRVAWLLWVFLILYNFHTWRPLKLRKSSLS